jgi:hypothetical protein
MKFQNINYTVELEAEFWAKGGWTPVDDNSNVWVVFENGEKWTGIFFSYQNILSLRDKNEQTGECLNGKYFCAENMILIDEISRESIESVIKEMIEKNEFDTYFSKCDE